MTHGSPYSIAMLGAGAWGTAVAQLLAENGHQVTLWCYEQEVCQDIKIHRINSRYLPGITLHKNITATSDLVEVVRNYEWIFEALPVAYMRTVLEPLKGLINPKTTWIILSKGIEYHSMFVPSVLLSDVCAQEIRHVVVSGPSFSNEVVAHQPTAVMVASQDLEMRQRVCRMLSASYFTCFESDDVVGVQLGGALKNVIALAVGIAQGLGYKLNTSAYIITQGLKEIETIMSCFGGQPQTVHSLAVFGDLILTCTGALSKNVQAGKLLAQDRDLEKLSHQFGALPEGINTLKSIYDLVRKCHLTLPICTSTYEFIFNNASFTIF